MTKNSLAKYYQDKKKNKNKAFGRHQSLSREKKEKKQQYFLTENKKTKPAECRKKYYKMR